MIVVSNVKERFVNHIHKKREIVENFVYSWESMRLELLHDFQESGRASEKINLIKNNILVFDM